MTPFSELRTEQAKLTVSETARQLGYTERQIYRFEAGETEPRKACSRSTDVEADAIIRPRASLHLR